MLIICFVSLENVNKSICLPSYLLWLSVGKGRKKGRGKARKVEPRQVTIENSRKLSIQILSPVLAWNLEYQILNFCGAPRARDWLVAM